MVCGPGAENRGHRRHPLPHRRQLHGGSCLSELPSYKEPVRQGQRHLVLSLHPVLLAPGARHTGGGPSDRPGAGGAVLPRLRSAGGYPHRPGPPPLPPGSELREAGHRGKAPLHPPDLGADAAGQRPNLPGAWADHPEAVSPEKTGQRTPAGGVPQCHAGTELEVSADRGDRGGHGAHRQPGGVPERAAAPGLRCPVGGRPETHHLHHPYGNAVPGRQAPRGKI